MSLWVCLDLLQQNDRFISDKKVRDGWTIIRQSREDTLVDRRIDREQIYNKLETERREDKETFKDRRQNDNERFIIEL